MYVTQISLDRQLVWGIFKSCRYRQLLFPGNFLAGLVLRVSEQSGNLLDSNMVLGVIASCPCNTTAMPLTDWRKDAALWVRNIWDNRLWAAAFPDCHPLFELEGFSILALGADLMHIHIGDIYSHTHTAQQAALLLGHRQVWAGTAARHSIDAMGHRKAGAAPPTKHSEQEKVLRTCVGAFNGTAMISHWNYNRITTLITCVSNMSLQFHLKPNLVSDRYWDRVIVVAARLQWNCIGMSMEYRWHRNKPLTVLW